MTDKSRKAVPREATDAMLAAAMRAEKEYGDDYLPYGSAWRVMFDAAPVLATAPADDALQALSDFGQLQTAPAEPPNEEIAMSSGTLREAARWLDTGKGRRPDGCTLRCIADVIDRLEPSPPSGEVAALIEREPQRVHQTTFGKNGDCFACCVATLMGVDLSEIPAEVSSAAQFKAIREWALKRGWRVVTLSITEEVVKDQLAQGYVIVSGKSSRGLPHAVIFKDGKLWHDPHPSLDGVEVIDEVDLFMPLNPALARLSAPVPDKPETSLMRAAKAVVWFDWSDNDQDAVAAISELRRAVEAAPAQECRHRWITRRSGGALVEAASDERVTYCDICGEEPR